MDSIDFGVAFTKDNGNMVKVTMNVFNNRRYVHIREYMLDGDTGYVYPTKSGYAIDADEVSSVIYLLEKASEKVAQEWQPTNQLSLFDEE